MSQSPIKLLLVDDDPIFRLGLDRVLDSVESLMVIGQYDTETILEQLLDPHPDLILLDPMPGKTRDEAWQLCQSLDRKYPTAKLILFSSPIEPEAQLTAQTLGIVGYIPKGTGVEDLTAIIRLIADGESYWPSLSLVVSTQPLTTPQTHWLIRLGQSGLSEIEDSLALVQERLEQPQLSNFDWLYWSGRKRELLAAAWLVRKLLPVGVPRLAAYRQVNNSSVEVGVDAQPLPLPSRSELPILSSSRPLSSSVIFDRTLAKIQLGLENATDVPMEIDILPIPRKRELLYIILDRLRKIADELRFLQISSQELSRRESLILQEIWEEATRKFLAIHVTPVLRLTDEQINIILIEETHSLQEEIFDKIPFVNDLLSYLIFEKGLLVEQVEYRANSPEAVGRAETLLQNLITMVANGVVAIILNNFSNYEEIKQTLYNQFFLSSREIARLRNQLSWKYRKEKYWEEPEWMFESKYRLFFYEGSKIQQTFIYAPRQAELARLRGIPWVVTIALEGRDAIAPQARTVISLLGKGVVYLLIQVIGRGIGLIIRGILQGIGNAWQDVRYGKRG